MKSFWSRCEQYPPILVRLLARRKNGPPLLTREIVSRSGLLSYQVDRISFETTWNSVSFIEIRSFLTGCNLDFCNRASMKRVDVYMKCKNRFGYLQQSPEWNTVLSHLRQRYMDYLRSKLRPK